MPYQVLQFNGKYFRYKGTSIEDLGLTIDRFKSAFCSNLLVRMIFDKLERKLF